MSFEIVHLADRPELAETLADALTLEWPEWYGRIGREAAVAEMRERAQRDAIPLGLVALEDGQLVGTAALNPSSIPTHPHLTPWLGGLWVAPAARGRGLGEALVGACRAEAARLGFERLYAATATARSLFLRDGWEEMETVTLDAHPGELIAVFRYELPAQDAPRPA